MSSRAQEAKALIRQFRVRELTDCLTRLGLSKTGLKQALYGRLLHAVDEASAASMASGIQQRLDQVARIIEECHQRMLQQQGRGWQPVVAPPPPSYQPPQAPVAPPPPPYMPHGQPAIPGLGPRSPGTWPQAQRAPVPGTQQGANGSIPGSSHAQAPGAGSGAGRQMRCLCGSLTERGELVQCQGCKTYQHTDCYALPHLTVGQRRTPHWCDRCRAERCDPFWYLAPEGGNVLGAAQMTRTGRSGTVGTKLEPVQTLERTFTVTQAQWDNFRKRPDKYKLQCCCIQLNDTVAFRYHWPTMCELRINNNQYRVYSRAPSNKMGANQRDEPANIGVLCQPPGKINKISVTCVDNGNYIVFIQLVKHRTPAEVKALMKPAETLAEATARVRKEFGHKENANGEEEEDELQVTHSIQSLRCPLSGSRMKTPARFADVPGMACFDLDSFLSMVERSRRWQCPNSMRNSCVQNLQVDTYMVTLLASLSDSPDMIEVEIAPNATWRPTGGSHSAAWYDVGQKPAAPAVKKEPGLAVGNGYDDSDAESEDEFEELRKAAQAVKRRRETANGNGKTTEVIELLDSDSDDDDAARPAKRAATGAGVGASGARNPAPARGNPLVPPLTVQSPAAIAAAALNARTLGVTVVDGPQGPTISVNAMQPARQTHNPQAHRAPLYVPPAAGPAGPSTHAGGYRPPSAAARHAAATSGGGSQHNRGGTQGTQTGHKAAPIVIEIDSD